MRFVYLLALLFVVMLAGCTSPTPAPPPPVLTITVNLPAATVGEVYAQQFTATGGTAPYIWSVVIGGLPAGLTLSSSGVVSGIPSSSGSFSFTIQVIDSAASSADIQIGGKTDENS
jgi:hypothetical protein